MERKRQSSYSSAVFILPLLYMQMTNSIWRPGTPHYIGKHDVCCIHYRKPFSWESGCICFFSKMRVHQVEGNNRGVSRLFLEVLRKPVYGISADSLLSRMDGPYSSPTFIENLKYNLPLTYPLLYCILLFSIPRHCPCVCALTEQVPHLKWYRVVSTRPVLNWHVNNLTIWHNLKA